MGTKHYTIGQLARLGGLSVRRIRFYSDKGLLPPADRTQGNYRLYTDLDLARLDLIQALRQAGIGLNAAAKLLARKLSLAEVLRARLDVLEAEIAAKRRIASVLRATLRSPDPTDQELRRLWTMTALSNAQMTTLVERFVARIAEDATIGEEWRRRMVETSTPTLPDDPAPEQIEAWNELAAMLGDESFIAEMRSEMSETWRSDFDPAAYMEAADRVTAAIRAAIDTGVGPASPEGQTVARDWLESSARVMRREPDAAFLRWHLDHYRKHGGRRKRYVELLAMLRGDAQAATASNVWTWMNEALRALPKRAA